MLLRRGSIAHTLIASAYWRLPRVLRNASIIRELCYRLFRKPCKIVQIGANDGRHNDPIFDFLANSMNHALLVEPHPAHFEALQESYASTPNATFVNAGIGSNSQMPLYSTPLRQGIESFDIEHVRRLTPKHYHESIESTVVQCMKFNALIDEHPTFRDADLLLIDAEGMDVQIIADIDFGQFSPSAIVFEAKNCREPEQLSNVERLLVEAGFAVGHQDGECIAIHRLTKNRDLAKMTRLLDQRAKDSANTSD